MNEEVKLKTWQWEFIWFKYPNARTSETDLSNQALARDTNFKSREARTFRAGWDAAVHVAGTHLQIALNELGAS